MENCHNCGLPADCITGGGVKVTLDVRAQGKYQRDRKQTVWCHSEECAIQALAIALYGPEMHKWPITLAEFRSTNPLSASVKKTPRSAARDLVWADRDKSRLEQRKSTPQIA
jgi:hypothetical protein